MITCTFCCKTLESLRGYVLHCRVHRNEPSCVFKCLGTECKRTFCTYAAFKTHFYRVHNVASQPESAKAVVAKLKCTISLCGHRSQTVKEVVAHLKEHIMEGRPVACPVKACKKVFNVKSSFTAHMSRKHRDFSVDNIDVLYKETTNKIVSLTPTIIVCGQSCFHAKRFMLSVDQQIGNNNISCFISALCMMFGSYYCFNIHYPSGLASTLEFLQRCFFSINPDKGSKVEETRKPRLRVNPRVLTLIQELSDHEWRDV